MLGAPTSPGVNRSGLAQRSHQPALRSPATDDHRPFGVTHLDSSPAPHPLFSQDGHGIPLRPCASALPPVPSKRPHRDPGTHRPARPHLSRRTRTRCACLGCGRLRHHHRLVPRCPHLCARLTPVEGLATRPSRRRGPHHGDDGPPPQPALRRRSRARPAQTRHRRLPGPDPGSTVGGRAPAATPTG